MAKKAYDKITDYLSGVSASGDLSSYQYRAMYLASGSQVKLPDGSSSQLVIGVLHNEPADGEAAQVAYKSGDVTKLICAVTTCVIAVGNHVTADSSGYGVRETTTGCPYFARAMEATSGSGIISVLLERGVVTTASRNM